MFSKIFIDRPRFAIVISLIMVLAGVISLTKLPVAEYPEIAPPSLYVTAMYPGASGEVIAQTVAMPIEDQINGVDDLLYFSSACSNAGSYSCTVTFKSGTDTDIAMVNLQNAIKRAEPQLPTDVTKLGITVEKRGNDILAVYAFTTDESTLNMMELNNYINVNVKDAITRLDGVSSAEVMSLEEYSMRIWLDPLRMAGLGISTKDIDDLVEKTVKEHGMKAAEKGYCGYPASVCTSVNDEVVHGIPSKDRILNEGDIVSCDLVVEYKGYMADACRTYGVGQISEEAQHLIDTAELAFFNGIRNAVPGKRLRDISREVQNTVEGEGFGVIRDYCGHGIGSEMHEDPQIPNYVCAGPNPRLQKGMALCIEPMITEGSWKIEVLDDDWTAVTVDGGWAAQFKVLADLVSDENSLLFPSCPYP